jgi:riboflavin biosynthesis pyrimidine reductase
MRELLPTLREVGSQEELEVLYSMPARAHLRADFITSLDGRVEADGYSRSLSAPADGLAFKAMRAVADVILVGAGTVRAEGYGPVKLAGPVQERRKGRGQEALPRLAIVTARADLDPQAAVFGGSVPPLLVTSSQAAETRPDLAAVADVITAGETEVDLRAGLDALRARGLAGVLSEGGPTLLRSLLEADLVDELCLSISPVVVGPQHVGLLGQGSLSLQVSFELSGLIEGDGLLLTRYARVPSG